MPSRDLRLAVLAGGAVGTALRLAVVAGVGAAPWGTLLVNVTGAGALGYVVGRVRTDAAASPAMALAATGVLGAYTTFSALAVEVLGMLAGAPVGAVLYGLGSIALGLAAAGAGLASGGRRRHARGSAA